ARAGGRQAPRAHAHPADRPRPPPRQAGGAAARRLPRRARGSARDPGAPAVDLDAMPATTLARRAFLGGAVAALAAARAFAQSPAPAGPVDPTLPDDRVARQRTLAGQG